MTALPRLSGKTTALSAIAAREHGGQSEGGKRKERPFGYLTDAMMMHFVGPCGGGNTLVTSFGMSLQSKSAGSGAVGEEGGKGEGLAKH